MLGQTVGDNRYRLKRLIGTGGTADVYEADDARLKRTVAVKLLHQRVVEDTVLAARLTAEVQMSRTLAHRSIVEVYDYSEENPAYLIMEYMAGGDLRKRLLSIDRLPGREVARIGELLLEALGVAHERGIVHRDLKPRNVLFTADGAAKIADFGLARSVTAAGLFQRGTIAGTPEYTAPETITASLWDPRSDLYALGCTLYEAATGSPPFVANTPAEVLRMQVETPAPDLPAEIAENYPRLSQLVTLLLQKDPNKRPQTAGEALGLLSDGATRAIAVHTPVEPCPSCGAPLSRHYGWCFTCGRPNLPVQRDREGYTILVTGPGKSGEKTRPEFRDACSDVVAAAGLNPAKMQKQVPRLPFVLAQHVDYGGAVRLSDELRSIGAEITLVGAGEESKGKLFRAIARKAFTMTPRVYLVTLTMGGATWMNVGRNAPPIVLIGGVLAVFAAVPVVLAATFWRATARWRENLRGTGGDNVTRLLATVRDPLIHARMKSIAESARSLAAEASSDQSVSESEKASILQWSEEMVERTAGLCIGLDAARSSRDYSHDAQADAEMLRTVDALYNRTLELIGRSALDIRELAVRSARAQKAQASLDLGELRSIVSRFGDEGEAWREIRELEGNP